MMGVITFTTLDSLVAGGGVEGLAIVLAVRAFSDSRLARVIMCRDISFDAFHWPLQLGLWRWRYDML